MLLCEFNLGVNGQDVFGEMMFPAELCVTDRALEGLPLLVDRLDVTLKVVGPGETLGALLAGKGLGGCLVILVSGKDVSSEVMLL